MRVFLLFFINSNTFQGVTENFNVTCTFRSLQAVNPQIVSNLETFKARDCSIKSNTILDLEIIALEREGVVRCTLTNEEQIRNKRPRPCLLSEIPDGVYKKRVLHNDHEGHVHT